MDYREKFDRIAANTLYPHLTGEQRQRVAAWASQFRLTQQELQRVVEQLRDLAMWDEPEGSKLDGVAACPSKGAFLAALSERHQALQQRGPQFDAPPLRRSVEPVVPQAVAREKLGLGCCPVASPRTRCCNLLTLDMVENCGFGCSYCSIQGFYGEREVTFDRAFAQKLESLQLDPDRLYHIGTGQSSDSLMWGNSHGALEALLQFAARHPNVILELKSKSANVGYLLDHPVPPNVIATWSLNPQQVIDHEEPGTASLKARLAAARRLADQGVRVGFHFHPMIRFAGWASAYAGVTREIQQGFTPVEVLLVSIGTLTFTKSVIRHLRREGRASKILQMPLEPAAGKLSYPDSVKVELFRTLYLSFSEAWRKGVFFYLCMEDPALWGAVFGFEYADNDAFERAMLEHYRRGIAGAGSLQ